MGERHNGTGGGKEMQNAEKGAQWDSPALIKDKANELPMGGAR